MSLNLGCKTPISFDLRKYVESIATAHSKTTTKHEKYFWR